VRRLSFSAQLPLCVVSSVEAVTGSVGVVWDYQCNFDGRLRPFLECSDHSTYMEQQYMCVQYPDLCDPGRVANYTVRLGLGHIVALHHWFTAHPLYRPD
jgi:hypothetical protein